MSAERAQLGWLDANLFIHPFFRDPHADPCRAIIKALREGRAEGHLDPVTIHELTYALNRYVFRQDRQAVANYLSTIVALETVHVTDKEVTLKALEYWAQGRCDKYGDARLRTVAEITQLPVCTVNRKDFSGVRNTYPFGADGS